MLSAYVDASQQGSGILTVAAVAYGPDRAKKAHARWKKLWGDAICHMTDLHSRKGDFAGWDGDRVSTRFKDSVGIVRDFATYCVAVSCDVGEYATVAPEVAAEEHKAYLDGFRNAYPFCMHMAMMALGCLVKDPDGIHYFIESGDKDQGQARKFIQFASGLPYLGNLYRVRSHTVGRKQDFRLLEGADILAWEWTKHVRRDPDDPRVRKSLAVLLEADADDLKGRLAVSNSSRYAIHYGGPILAEHMQDTARLLINGPSASKTLGYRPR